MGFDRGGVTQRRGVLLFLFISLISFNAFSTDYTEVHPSFLFRAQSPKRVLRVMTHLHTQHDSEYVRRPRELPIEKSYSSSGILKLKQRARRQGIDVLVVTEHNTVAHCLDKNFVSEPDLLLICGEEWTTKRGPHLNFFLPELPASVYEAILPPDTLRAGTEAEVAEAIAEAHRRGWYASINHPGLPQYQLSQLYDADFIEALVPAYSFPNLVANWWQSKLALGLVVPGIGASDFHPNSKFRGLFVEPVNEIAVEDDFQPTPTNVIELLRGGRGLMLNKYKRKISLRLQAKSGEQTAEPGSELHVSDSGAIVELEIKNAAGMQLRGYDETGLAIVRTLKSNADYISYRLDDIHPVGFLRFELRTPNLAVRAAMINPVYFRKRL